LLYFLLALAATILGAVIGIGGGLIIRPMLTIWDVGKTLASFSSAITVFAMATATMITHYRRGIRVSLSCTLYLAIGSISGGFFGGGLMQMVSAPVVNIAYVFVLVLVLGSVLGRPYIPSMKVEHPVAQFLIGLLTGTMSGFFGIGGGPFQMVALLLFFNLCVKDAAVQSVFITLLTTASTLVRYAIDGDADFSIAIYMIPAAILGGIIGGSLNRKMNDKAISWTFCTTIVVMIALQILKVSKVI
jgi:uncharacterized membrane protein YfcA